jgi:hypothetical protein
MAGSQEKQSEFEERKKNSRGTEQYGAGPGSSGSGNVRVQSNTPENRAGELNPSAPTESTEGPSTNLANHRSDSGGPRTKGEPARGEHK